VRAGQQTGQHLDSQSESGLDACSIKTPEVLRKRGRRRWGVGTDFGLLFILEDGVLGSRRRRVQQLVGGQLWVLLDDT